ncbi:hypothetical protein Tco_1373877, partial [Tanacetum coccineum]
MLKVSLWKGVIHFGKKGKLAPSLHVPLDEIKVDKTLRFVEEPVEIMDRVVKRLKRSKISLVKVRWNSKRGPELVKPLVLTYVLVAIYGIIREVFVKLLLDSFGKLSISMSPPIRRKYHDSVVFSTGCKRIKNSKRCNRKIRIPIAMWSCRVEEKMILKEVDGQTVEDIETKIIAKDGTITRVPGKFQGYETSEEEP